MNSFKKHELSDCYWFQEGPGVRKWQFTSHGIKLLNGANITKFGELELNKTEKYLSNEEVAEKYKHFLIDAGDLVIASSGVSFDESDGMLRTRAAFVKPIHLPLCMNTSTIRFKAKEGADLLFLKFWLESFEFRSQITKLVTGSAQQNFGLSHLKELSISLPPLDEQKRIAAVLERADHLRRTRRFARTMSDTFLQSVFLQMFGDPVSNPMDWNMDALESQLSRIDSGWSPVCGETRLRSSDWAVLKLSAVTGGEFLPHENKQLLPDVAPRLNLEVQKGDVLFTRKNTENLVAACAYVFQTPPRLLLPDTIFRFVLKVESDVDPVFLWATFNNKMFRRKVQLLATGSAGSMPNISKEKLLDVAIPLPPIEKQQQFAAIVRRFERVRAGQIEAERQAEHLFQTLLHRAFAPS